MNTTSKLDVITIPNVVDAETCYELKNLPPIKHHGDEEGHAVHAKDLWLPHLARKLNYSLKNKSFNKGKFLYVDPFMKLYKLEAPLGIVEPHIDENFKNSHGETALYSVIVYLNDNYEGGETVFENEIKVYHKEGDVLVFAHDIIHSGLAVSKGTKYVIKTDIFIGEDNV